MSGNLGLSPLGDNLVKPLDPSIQIPTASPEQDEISISEASSSVSSLEPDTLRNEIHWETVADRLVSLYEDLCVRMGREREEAMAREAQERENATSRTVRNSLANRGRDLVRRLMDGGKARVRALMKRLKEKFEFRFDGC